MHMPFFLQVFQGQSVQACARIMFKYSMTNFFHILLTYPPINTLITHADKKELLYNCRFILDNLSSLASYGWTMWWKHSSTGNSTQVWFSTKTTSSSSSTQCVSCVFICCLGVNIEYCVRLGKTATETWKT